MAAVDLRAWFGRFTRECNKEEVNDDDGDDSGVCDAPTAGAWRHRLALRRGDLWSSIHSGMQLLQPCDCRREGKTWDKTIISAVLVRPARL